MNKNCVLIVDPVSTGVLYANKFSTKNLLCFALVSPTLVKSKRDKIRQADFVEVFHDIDTCVEKLNKYKINAVVAGCEDGVTLAEKMAAVLDCATNDSSIADLRRDKYVMQTQLKQHGLRSIKTLLVDEKSDLTSVSNSLFDSRTGYILKPKQSCASDNVSYSSNVAELIAKLRKVKWDEINALGEVNNNYLIQEFITGGEYVVDMVAINGNYIVCSICVYEKIEINTAPVVYYALNVCDINSPEFKVIVDYAKQVASVLGFTVGPIHMELKVDTNGPVLIEVGARLHGGIAPELFNICYTPNLLDVAVSSYLLESDNIPLQSSLVKQGRIVFLVSATNKIFNVADEIMNNIKSIASYQGHYFMRALGSKLIPTIDLFSCPLIVWLAGEDTQQLLTDDAEIRQLLQCSLSDE